MLYPKSSKLAAILFCTSLLAAVAVVAAAEPLELLDHGSSGYINGAFFLQVDPEHSTGTGVIQPFLRVQKNGIEEGYNTDYSPKEFPETESPWTKSLLLSDVPLVLRPDGVIYREFLLDVNESGGGGNQFISLDRLQIFLGSAPDLTGYPSGLGTMIWDMDAGAAGDTWINLDYDLEAGSGDGDMLAYIPNSLFADQGSYVYLYCKFGLQGGGLDCSDGFEEWAVRVADTPIPEPASLLALSTGLISLVGVGRRRLRK